jgi:hypothetical protein
VLAEVGDDVALLLRQVRVVRLAAGQDCLPPSVAARVGAGTGADRVVGLLGCLVAAALQQDRVEDLLLCARVDLEQVGAAADRSGASPALTVCEVVADEARDGDAARGCG